MARVRGKSGVSLTAKSCDPVAVYLIGIVESLKMVYSKVRETGESRKGKTTLGYLQEHTYKKAL